MNILKRVYLLFYLSFFSLSSINAHGFAANTLVKSSNEGWWAIEQIVRLSKKQKQYVMSYDRAHDAWVNKQVTSGALSTTNCYIKLKLRQSCNIDCTPTQEFYLADQKRWLPAYVVKVGDVLLADQNKHVQVDSVEFVQKSLDVYSIQVQDTHTFLVGPHSIITHNMIIPAIAAGLSIPFSTGCSAGAIGATLGPIGFIGGLAVVGIIGCAIKFGMRNKVTEYKLSYDVDKIGSYFEAKDRQEINKTQNNKKKRNRGGSNKNDDNDSKLSNQIEISKDDLQHIFRDAPGHLADTPEHRQLLIDVVSKKSNFLGKCRWGNEWYSQMLSDGKQAWAYVRNGIIRNGGLNNTPRTFNDKTGLSSLLPKT